jgi:uncharacterized damage-inducible protein DinB
MQATAPEFPVGPYCPPTGATDQMRGSWIADIAALPSRVRQAVDGLTGKQLDTKYRNWTIRQIVHHIADSHVNSYIRFKWTLTEDTPTIKAYDEVLWTGLAESQQGCVVPSLLLLDGLHARWCQLLETLAPFQYERAFVHPESGQTITLNSALAYYAWHGKHHTGQIQWLCDRHEMRPRIGSELE